MAFANQF